MSLSSVTCFEVFRFTINLLFFCYWRKFEIIAFVCLLFRLWKIDRFSRNSLRELWRLPQSHNTIVSSNNLVNALTLLNKEFWCDACYFIFEIYLRNFYFNGVLENFKSECDGIACSFIAVVDCWFFGHVWYWSTTCIINVAYSSL